MTLIVIDRVWFTIHNDSTQPPMQESTAADNGDTLGNGQIMNEQESVSSMGAGDTDTV